MQALTYDPAAARFQMAELPIPTPEGKDVLVKVEACGLNPVDAKIGLWQGMVPDMDASWVPGLDVSGEVAAVGPDVTRWKVGDRVLCHGNMFRPHGGFAEFTIQDGEILIPHPALPAEIAAATPCAGWTAWRALVDKLHAHQGHSLLIAGASGGVGGFAIQIARTLGVSPIIATCSGRNVDHVLRLGASHAIDYTREDVISRVLAITAQHGVSLGLDCVGEDTDILVANALGFEGQMVELVTTLRPASYQDAFMRGLSFHQLSLGSGHRGGAAGKQTLIRAGQAFSALVEQGKVEVPRLRTIALENVGDALGEMLKQRTVGKIVMLR